MEEDHGHLRPPLRPPTATDDLVTTNPIIVIFRLCLVGFIGIVSVWANHEASKGYAITIVNESGQTLPGKRFQLLYVSNDEATRIILEASMIIESFLYSDTPTTTMKKPIRHVILKLAGQSLTDDIVVDSAAAGKFVINMSPSVLEGTNFDEAVILAIRKGVARVWVWDNGPISLINGIVEYIVVNMATEAEPPDIATACGSGRVAGVLSYFERRRPGFIRRLNVAMKDGILLDDVLNNMCTSYRYESLRYNMSSVEHKLHNYNYWILINLFRGALIWLVLQIDFIWYYEGLSCYLNRTLWMYSAIICLFSQCICLGHEKKI